jgi:hypothetical protein
MRFPSIKDVSSAIRGIVRYPELADPENEDHEGNWMDVIPNYPCTCGSTEHGYFNVLQGD